jgi:hypothetical protein
MKIYYKNILTCSIILTFILLFHTFSFAQEGKDESVKIISNTRETWEVGPEISYIRYKEPSIKDKGTMYGIGGSYAYHNYIMLKAEGKFAYGQLDYEGSTWENNKLLTVNGIPNYMLEFRGLLGYDFAANIFAVTPYLGFGYRWLNDNMQEKSPSGYKRESNYLYLPIGLEVVANLGNGWFWGADVEYDFFLWGEQKSFLSDNNPKNNDIENKQKKGYGVRGSMPITKKGEKVGFVIEPYVKYWNIDDSDYQSYTSSKNKYAYEPKNNSTEIGCKLAIMF